MDTKYEKVLANGGRVAVKLKRKQPEQSTMSEKGSKAKRSKPGRSSSDAFASGKRLLKYYSNYKKISGLKRLMFYRNNKWKDFPQDVVAMVNKEVVKNPAVEVDVDGCKILLDFLHMTKLDMETGLSHPIAWIDVSDKCFFPELIGDYDEANFNESAEGHDVLEDINLHLEIEIRELDVESCGESNTVIEQPLDKDDAATVYCDVGINESCVKGPIVKAIASPEGNLDLIAARQPGSMAIDVLNEMFLKAIGSSTAKIVEVRRCSSVSMEARWEIFCKQIEITRRYRGDANVQYAWLPCSKTTASAIQKFGVGYYEQSKIRPMHGIGVHLIPANGTNISLNYFDGDENGVQYMALCRVIMGNMEFVRSGSILFHPSSEDYDSGADNLLSPNKYVVWNMNANSHIYPECVVSFKAAPDFEAGRMLENGGRLDNSGISTCDGGPQGHTPNSPWVSFSMLFEAITGRIPSDSMELLKKNYELFKNKRIARETFVKMLRAIVGDALLKVAITTLRAKTEMKVRPTA